jgi:hypothetical protein
LQVLLYLLSSFKWRHAIINLAPYHFFLGRGFSKFAFHIFRPVKISSFVSSERDRGHDIHLSGYIWHHMFNPSSTRNATNWDSSCSQVSDRADYSTPYAIFVSTTGELEGYRLTLAFAKVHRHCMSIERDSLSQWCKGLHTAMDCGTSFFAAYWRKQMGRLLCGILAWLLVIVITSQCKFVCECVDKCGQSWLQGYRLTFTLASPSSQYIWKEVNSQ